MSVVAKDGSIVTEEMMDKWACDAEQGIYPGTPGPTFIGRPPIDGIVTESIRPDISVNSDLWELIISKARRLGVSTDAIVQHALAREVSTMQ